MYKNNVKVKLKQIISWAWDANLRDRSLNLMQTAKKKNKTGTIV